MSLSDADIKKVAHLARLSLSETQIPEYAANISKILALVEQINEANTDGVKPMSHPMKGLTQRLRSDEVTEDIDRENFQAHAPATEDGLYLVPKVIEDKS